MKENKTFSLDQKKEASKYIYLKRLVYPEYNFYLIAKDDKLVVTKEERKRSKND